MRNALSGLALSLSAITLSCSAASPPPGGNGEGTTSTVTAPTTSEPTTSSVPEGDGPPAACDKPGRKYTGKTADICSRIRFFCEPGFVAFHDDCGCGCDPEAAQNPPPPTKAGSACGKSTCTGDQFCCNPSCGICAPKGGACTQQVCD